MKPGSWGLNGLLAWLLAGFLKGFRSGALVEFFVCDGVFFGGRLLYARVIGRDVSCV